MTVGVGSDNTFATTLSGSNAPVPVIEASFTTNPTATPVWQSISPWVERFSFQRGRQQELARVQAGTLTLDLSNLDRRFENYSGSPYYPGVLPMRRIRVRSSYVSAEFPMWGGYVESWSQRWPGYQDAVTTVTASDAFKPISLGMVTGSFPAQLSSDRINAILDAIHWTVGGAAWRLGTSRLGRDAKFGPTGDRSIGVGSVMVQAADLSNTSALDHLQSVAETEGGLLFIDRAGTVVFRGAKYSVRMPPTFTNGIFGELEMPYVDLQGYAKDDTEIYNDVRITPNGGVEQVRSDLTSQGQYFLRTLPLTTLHADPLEAYSRAGRLLNRYAQPKDQIASITLDGEANPSQIYPQMLERELGDRVTVRRRPASGGSMIEQISTIEGISISYEAEGGIWSTTWRLSPANTNSYWRLGTSLLGSTTRLF